LAGQPEIRIMTDFFNSKVKKSVVCDVRMIQTKTVKETSDRVKEQKWNVSSTSRGKEIKVIFQNDQDKHELLVHFFKGGVWEWYENDDEVKKNPNYERDHRFSIHFEDGTIMSHQDQFHQSHWKWSDKWGNYRSPDIVTENNPWRKHMFDHRKKLRVDRPIFEMMLHPWFFNGVNNFTRSEILCRTSFSPFTPCIEIFTSEELREDLFDTTKKVLEEVYELGGTQFNLWKNPFGVDPEPLKRWIRVYRNDRHSWVVEKNKVFYFDRKWKADGDKYNLMKKSENKKKMNVGNT